MTAKEYLQRVRGVQAEVAQLRRLRQRAYEQATRATARPSKAPAHSSGDGGGLLAGYADCAAELDHAVERLLAVEREVLAVIAQVPDSRYRRLLRARYVEGKTWEEIAVDMGYNYQHVVQRLHPQALHAVEEIMR